MTVSELIKELIDWLIENGADADVGVVLASQDGKSGQWGSVTEISEPHSFICSIRSRVS